MLPIHLSPLSLPFHSPHMQAGAANFVKLPKDVFNQLLNYLSLQERVNLILTNVYFCTRVHFSWLSVSVNIPAEVSEKCTTGANTNLTTAQQRESFYQRIYSLRSRAVTCLDLSNCRSISMQPLTLLASTLQDLNLSHRKNIALSGLTQLKEFSFLRSLNLASCILKEEHFDVFALLSQLTHLNLSLNDNLTDALLPKLADLSALQALELMQCTKITGEGFIHLTHLTGLATLDLSNCAEVTQEGLKSIVALKRLKTLILAGCDGTDQGNIKYRKRPIPLNFTVLSGLSYLQRLNLQWSGVTDADLFALAKLNHLHTFILTHCSRITDKGVYALSSLTKLYTLNLSECKNIKGHGLVGLTNLMHLRALNLSGSKEFHFRSRITHEGLEAIVKLPYLEHLNVCDCEEITDEGVRLLATLSTLKSLDISLCISITNAGLVHLSHLIKLESLNIDQLILKINLTAFEALRSLPSLTFLRTTDGKNFHNARTYFSSVIEKPKSVVSLS